MPPKKAKAKAQLKAKPEAKPKAKSEAKPNKQNQRPFEVRRITQNTAYSPVL
jgi:hypothetical protein